MEDKLPIDLGYNAQGFRVYAKYGTGVLGVAPDMDYRLQFVREGLSRATWVVHADAVLHTFDNGHGAKDPVGVCFSVDCLSSAQRAMLDAWLNPPEPEHVLAESVWVVSAGWDPCEPPSETEIFARPVTVSDLQAIGDRMFGEPSDCWRVAGENRLEANGGWVEATEMKVNS